MRDKAVSMLLKTSLVIGRWIDCEAALVQMKKRTEPQRIEEIEQRLPKRYVDSLELISSVYKSGMSRTDRVGMFLSSYPPRSIDAHSRLAASLSLQDGDWEPAFRKLEAQNSVCGDLKSKVELEFKRNDANFVILDWIRICSQDPEPEHAMVKERTGIDDPTSIAGKWFLETPEFCSWIYEIREGTAKKPEFWMRGASRYSDMLVITLLRSC